MRTIKFRAWDKTKKRMGEVYSIILGSGAVSIWYEDSGAPTGWLMPDKVELMQFTGLTDKNGKEIYEGDIVKIWNGNNGENDPFIQEVKWSNTGGFLADKVDDGDYIPLLGNEDHEIEIIGNCYENPELINSPKQP